MRILLDARFYGLEHAGLGRYTMNLVNQLSKLDSKNEYIILLRQKYFNELKLPGNWQKFELETKHYTLKEQVELPRVIKKYNPDITHFLHSNIPLFFKGKFIVTIHDMTMYKQGMDATTLPLSVYLAKRVPFKMVFRKAVFESEKIIVPSHAVKGDIVQYFKVPREKIVVTHEGITGNSRLQIANNKLMHKYNLENKKYFLYVGNLYPHKNVKRVIEAIVKVNNDRITADSERIYFVIVSGRSVFRERLMKEIRVLGGDNYVKVIDFLPDEELQVLYANSVAFIFPSLSEGFGLPGLEALKAGTQLLASDTPVFREVYRNHAFYFDPLNSDSIKKTMEKILMGDKKMYAEELLKEYSWLEMAKSTLAVYY